MHCEEIFRMSSPRDSAREKQKNKAKGLLLHGVCAPQSEITRKIGHRSMKVLKACFFQRVCWLLSNFTSSNQLKPAFQAFNLKPQSTTMELLALGRNFTNPRSDRVFFCAPSSVDLGYTCCTLQRIQKSCIWVWSSTDGFLPSSKHIGALI